MTLPGQSDHIRLDTRPGPGITPTLDIHTLSGLLAKLRKVKATWDPGQSEEEKGGRARHREFCLSVGPHHLAERPAAAPVSAGPHPWLSGHPQGCWGRGAPVGSRRFYFPACQDPTSHLKPNQFGECLVHSTPPTLMGTPPLILKPPVKVSAALARRKCSSPDPERGTEIGQRWKSTWPAQESPNHQLFQNRKLRSWRGGHGAHLPPPGRDQHPHRPQCSSTGMKRTHPPGASGPLPPAPTGGHLLARPARSTRGGAFKGDSPLPRAAPRACPRGSHRRQVSRAISGCGGGGEREEGQGTGARGSGSPGAGLRSRHLLY